MERWQSYVVSLIDIFETWKCWICWPIVKKKQIQCYNASLLADLNLPSCDWSDGSVRVQKGT
jgi:hypothetical protein